ncbi:TPD1 protein [Canna indica]|uniref:TPD1 protein n=1 Tax=Canna indica TaxID=4628 RepID=A0AAQ3K5E0_9LILI|nr:TPD1 protein [Canna indica]
MAPFLKLLLFAAFMLHLSATAKSQRCDLSSIQVQQTNTGTKVGYDPVFEVEVKNLCRCTVTSVFLRSEGFASSVMVDPKLFRREGVGYLVNDGKGIPSSQSLKFRYAWDRAFKMSPASLQVNCL